MIREKEPKTQTRSSQFKSRPGPQVHTSHRKLDPVLTRDVPATGSGTCWMSESVGDNKVPFGPRLGSWLNPPLRLAGSHGDGLKARVRTNECSAETSDLQHWFAVQVSNLYFLLNICICRFYLYRKMTKD